MDLKTLEDELDRAIKATDDPKDRTMLMIMQKVLAHVEKLLDDEETLRMKVLNGDYHNHSEDHDLVDTLRKHDTIEAIKWVNIRRLDSKGYCEYAVRKMKEEIANNEISKTRWNRFIEAMVSELPKAILFAAVTLAGYGWLIK